MSSSRYPLILFCIIVATAIVLKIIYWIAPVKESSITIRGERIIVEVAQGFAEQERGLSGRFVLPQDHGMLFLYPEKVLPRFWMKGMVIPIDIVWIADGRIVGITADVPPPVLGSPNDTLPLYTPKVPVTMALEVHAGTAERLGWKVGDSVQLEL